MQREVIQPDAIIRSSRKTISLTIDPFGQLVVRAPYRCSEERIFEFIQEKQSWILTKRAERVGAGMRLPPENLDGYVFMLLGKDCKIVLTHKRRIEYDEESGLLYLPAKNARKRLVDWLKVNGQRIFALVAKQKAEEMQTTFSSVGVSSARTRWGSCSYDNALRFSFRLLYAPREVIEYIVVHELAHTKHKNHSFAFWAEVARYVPDYKAKGQWLKNHSIFMEIF